MIPNNSNTFLPPTPVIPGFLFITNITTSNPMVITVIDSVENTYIVNQCIHLCIPSSYGMVQANQLTGQIIAINGLNFSVDIDSTSFDPFISPATFQQKPASLAPAGSRNLEYSNFTNKVAFQSLNNRGN